MQGIERHAGGTSIVGVESIALFRLTMMLRCLGLEIKGIRMVRHSVYAQVKRELGFKGNKQAVYDQLVKHVQSEIARNEATPDQVAALLDAGKVI